MDHMRNITTSKKTILREQIQWVLTVPAIWNNAAKQVMRNAAQQAGLPTSKFPTFPPPPHRPPSPSPPATFRVSHIYILHRSDISLRARSGSAVLQVLLLFPFSSFSPPLLHILFVLSLFATIIYVLHTGITEKIYNILLERSTCSWIVVEGQST